MNFEQLIQAFEQANEYLQGKAVSAVNQSLTMRNWLFGHYIVEYEQNGEDRAKYGEKILNSISKKLQNSGVKGASITNLKLCRQFYILYPQIGQAVTDQSLRKSLSEKSGGENKRNEAIDGVIVLNRLSFTHIIELLTIEDPLKRLFYEVETLKGNWSVRELKRQIGSLLYERTGLSLDKKGLLENVNRKAVPIRKEDIIRDPYIFEFLGLAQKDEVSESDLETALLDHLQEFLMELGNGFCFEARQKRITVDNEHFYIDLIFYHRILKCHVLIDLKIRKFLHTDAGQMNFYLNYYRENEMYDGDDLPIGILLCADKDEATVKYAIGNIDNKVFVSRYKVALPSEKELEQFIKRDKKALGM
ncbi:MAG: PDDEXK nuclease domain-containing protein [Bacteroidales bacterium]|jgi:predicted nuclease of restriction endonuclease-like (RecB) superfamily|nr:PDDEXK nuclease domain-containing protein [Bacteroidales bacterium]